MTQLRRSKRIRRQTEFFAFDYSTRVKKSRYLEPRIRDPSTVVGDPPPPGHKVQLDNTGLLPTRKVFTKKREGWVTEFKTMKVASSPGEFPFQFFKDPEFVTALTTHLSLKIPGLIVEDVRIWIQRHAWITDEVQLEPPANRVVRNRAVAPRLKVKPPPPSLSSTSYDTVSSITTSTTTAAVVRHTTGKQLPGLIPIDTLRRFATESDNAHSEPAVVDPQAQVMHDTDPPEINDPQPMIQTTEPHVSIFTVVHPNPVTASKIDQLRRYALQSRHASRLHEADVPLGSVQDSTGIGFEDDAISPSLGEWMTSFFNGNRFDNFGSLLEINDLAINALQRSTQLQFSPGLARSAKAFVSETELELRRLVVPQQRSVIIKPEQEANSTI